MAERCLLVCGFNPTSATRAEAARAYAPLVAFLEARGATTVFAYGWLEDVEAVYARLARAIDAHGVVVAHSIGAALVARYFTERPVALRVHRAVVLCMPLVTADDAALALGARLPLAGLVPLPRALAFPRWLLMADAEAGAWSLADACAVACLAQPVTILREWVGRAIDARGVLAAPNVHVVYAECDRAAPIAPATLAACGARVRVLRGAAHYAWAGPAWRARAFFGALGAALGDGVGALGYGATCTSDARVARDAAT
jgi:hypothetical protein